MGKVRFRYKTSNQVRCSLLIGLLENLGSMIGGKPPFFTVIDKFNSLQLVEKLGVDVHIVKEADFEDPAMVNAIESGKTGQHISVDELMLGFK